MFGMLDVNVCIPPTEIETQSNSMLCCNTLRGPRSLAFVCAPFIALRCVLYIKLICGTDTVGRSDWPSKIFEETSIECLVIVEILISSLEARTGK